MDSFYYITLPPEQEEDRLSLAFTLVETRNVEIDYEKWLEGEDYFHRLIQVYGYPILQRIYTNLQADTLEIDLSFIERELNLTKFIISEDFTRGLLRVLTQQWYKDFQALPENLRARWLREFKCIELDIPTPTQEVDSTTVIGSNNSSTNAVSNQKQLSLKQSNTPSLQPTPLTSLPASKKIRKENNSQQERQFLPVVNNFPEPSREIPFSVRIIDRFNLFINNINSLFNFLVTDTPENQILNTAAPNTPLNPATIPATENTNIEQGLLEIISLRAETSINQSNTQGQINTRFAIENSHTDINHALPKPRDDFNSLNQADWATQLIIASTEGDTEVVRDLTRHPQVQEYNINTRNSEGRTPLMLAAENNHLEVIQVLITALNTNIDINLTTLYGRLTALVIAAQNGHQQIVAFLLGLPEINVTATDEAGFPVLIAAAQNGHLEVVQLLLDPVHSLNVNVTTGYTGDTALIVAVRNGSLEIVQALLKHPLLDINVSNVSRETPLRLAIFKKHIRIFWILINASNIQINPEDWDGHNLETLRSITNDKDFEDLRYDLFSENKNFF